MRHFISGHFVHTASNVVMLLPMTATPSRPSKAAVGVCREGEKLAGVRMRGREAVRGGGSSSNGVCRIYLLFLKTPCLFLLLGLVSAKELVQVQGDTLASRRLMEG